ARSFNIGHQPCGIVQRATLSEKITTHAKTYRKLQGSAASAARLGGFGTLKSCGFGTFGECAEVSGPAAVCEQQVDDDRDAHGK
ncbi:MAG: hypothetical protein ACKVS9_04160, partial [Phycisphaerae bacterium]